MTTTTEAARRVKKRRHRAGPPLGREFRFFSADGLEVRNDSDNDAILITGMPIVYNAPYTVRDMFGEFEETMLPGVADLVIAAGADVRFLFNHDGMPLARTLSGTLKLDTSSTRGLPMTASLDARSNLANDLAVAMERGDVTQMSCGFVVGVDSWTEDGTKRSISRFDQLFDVSAVTYPASPTTSIELAYRSLMSRPVESQARVRQLWVEVGRDFRAGTPLSAGNAAHLQTALDALRADDEVDVAELVREAAIDAQTADEARPEGQVRVGKPAHAPDTTDERRAVADMTYNDREQALSDALLAKYGPTDADDDYYYDMWVVDATDEWVVWRVYESDAQPGAGLWQIAYTLDDAGTVTFTGDPVQVATETSYVPVQRDDTPDPVEESAVEKRNVAQALKLEQERMKLRANRRRSA